MSEFSPGSFTVENSPFNSKAPFLGERQIDRQTKTENVSVCVFIYVRVYVYAGFLGIVSHEDFAGYCYQVTILWGSRRSALL